MSKHVTLKQQIDTFDQSQGVGFDLKPVKNVMAADGRMNDNGFWNFYDWFCKDSSLKDKGIRLMGMVKKFVKVHPEIDLEKHYVFFKNNCPMYGPLYDDFRICNIESGDVIWNVTPKSGHTHQAEVWGRENDFKEAIKTAKTFAELLA